MPGTGFDGRKATEQHVRWGEPSGQDRLPLIGSWAADMVLSAAPVDKGGYVATRGKSAVKQGAKPGPTPVNPATQLRDPVFTRLVSDLQKVPYVVAIALGGSRSIGTATAVSDFDVIVLVDRNTDLERDELRDGVLQLGCQWQTRTRKLLADVVIEGRTFELLFRPIETIAVEIANARKGQFKRQLNPLHTVGFLSTIMVSYATYALPVWDPEGKLKQLQDSAYPYPEVLRERMISTFRTEARLAVMHAGKTRSIHDVAHLMGLYARANAAWALVLFAANRRYPVIDKGGRQLVAAMPISPENYEFRTKAIFRAAAAGDLQGALDEANRLHAEICRLVAESEGGGAAATGE